MSDPSVIELYKPTAEPGMPSVRLAPRQPELDGRTVGFVYNLKFNADRLIDQFALRLRERYGVVATPVVQKHSDSLPAHPELLQELAKQSDAVVTLLGD